MTDLHANQPEPPRDDAEHPVPLVWCATLEAIVRCFIEGDWELEHAPANVERVAAEDAAGLAASVAGYGDVTLMPLPNTTWETSVCRWGWGRWDVLVDLWTAEEGRSDLVLHMEVTPDGNGYRFRVHFIYVP